MATQVFRRRVNQEVFDFLCGFLKCLRNQHPKLIEEFPVNLRTNEILNFFFCDHAFHHSLIGKRIFSSFLFVMEVKTVFLYS